MNRPFDRCLDYFGIGKSTLSRLIDRSLEEVLAEDATEIRQRVVEYDEAQIALIRPTMVEMIVNKERVHLTELLNRLKEKDPQIKWSRTTLYRIMKTRVGVTFMDRRNAYYDRLREDPTNVRRRND